MPLNCCARAGRAAAAASSSAARGVETILLSTRRATHTKRFTHEAHHHTRASTPLNAAVRKPSRISFRSVPVRVGAGAGARWWEIS
jgi:hypothetical protein